MGDDYPDEPGNPCAQCDGILWPADVTPKFVKITVAGLEVCPLNPNPVPAGDYVLQQHRIVACRWVYSDGLYNMSLDVRGATTDVVITESPAAGWTYFQGGAGVCGTHMDNIIVACGGLMGAKGGTVDVTW